MRRDAERYVPALRECTYVRSLWEIKTILPQSGVNDSRPILFKRDPSSPNVISILGSKIDNIYDLDEALPLPHDNLAPAHDPEKARPGPDPGWRPVFGKDHAPTKSTP